MKSNMKKAAFFILLLLVLAACAAFGLCAYSNYLLPRKESPWQTYQPFSGELFAIDSAGIAKIRVSSESGHHQHIYSSPGDVKKILSCLNAFRYFFWIPEPKGEAAIPAGDSAYGFLDFGRGGLTFLPNRMLVHTSFDQVSQGHRRQVTNSAWYYGGKDFFEKLEALRECDSVCKASSRCDALEKNLPPGWE